MRKMGGVAHGAHAVAMMKTVRPLQTWAMLRSTMASLS